MTESAMIRHLDPHAILAALGVPDADAVMPVLGGKDAVVFRVERGDEAFALRVFRLGEKRVWLHEMATMRAARAGGIPVPEVHASGIWQDRPALLLEWCAGRTVVEEAVANPARAEPLGAAAGQMLARLHQLEPQEGICERSWLDWFAIPDALAHALAAVAGPPRLLHLDYHPLNLLTEDAAITAVLDWTNARAGDPRADLARSLAILALNTDEAPVDVGAIVAAFERGLLDGYTEDAGPLDDMPLFLAWAGHGMLHDLARRMPPEKRDRIVAWTAEREREAGLR